MESGQRANLFQEMATASTPASGRGVCDMDRVSSS
jgi:hypothetical protein